jgi:ATP-dependent RNA helicase DeaD
MTISDPLAGVPAPSDPVVGAAAPTDSLVGASAPSDPFAGVPAPLRSALEKRGFTGLTRVQAAVLAAIGEADAGARNLRISSQTGSGKTVAIGLAVAARILEDEVSGGTPPVGPRALVITPTRELAAQVQTELEWLFEERPNVRVDVVTGGTDVRREKQRLRSAARILVGTPGRLLDHIRSRALNTSAIREVVLDEADQMLDMGFKDELDQIVASLPQERRSHLVSATFPPEVRRLAQSFQGDALQIEGTALGKANSDIEHIAYLTRPKEQYAAIVNLLLDSWGERCLIFVRTRAETQELCEALAGDGFGALPFSGELAQAQRTRTLDSFRNGTINILVATDVAARGIDVPGIGMVIHADVPKDSDIYTHRSGRTGRAGKTGKSLSVVPINAQARVARLLKNARIDVRWESVPSPKKILQGVTKATRRTLYERLEGAEYSEAELTYAQNLLEKANPAQVVSMLLRMAEPPLPRPPIDVTPCEPRAWDPRERPAPMGARAPMVRGARPGFVRFSLSWGQSHGATPSRCLSHVCRRAGINRDMIGAIDVGDESTSVEIAEAAALEFEERCRRPDPRDPHVRITRDGQASSVPPRNVRPMPERARLSFQKPRAPREDVAHAPPGPRVQRAARRPRPLVRTSEA